MAGGGPGSELRDVASLLDHALAATPDAEALVGRHARYSYAALDTAVDAAAAVLQDLGVSPGDRVAASAANCPELVIAFIAAMRIGAVWVGLAPQLAGPEKAYQLGDCGVRCFLADNKAAEQVAGLRGTLPELDRVVAMDPGEPRGEWGMLVEAARGRTPARVAIDRFAPAAIAYTSGTSGFPKGAVHSQHNIALVAASTLGGARGDQGAHGLKRGATIPLTMLNAMILTAGFVLGGGGCLVCIDRRDARGIAEWVRDEELRHVHLSGAHIHDMLSQDIPPAWLASLVFVNNAGAAIPVALRRRFEDRFGPRALTSYGLTEAPAGVSGFEIGAPYVEGSAGTVNRHLDVAILDLLGDPLAVGETGEICIRAAQSGPWAGLYRPMLGYWNRPEATAETLRGGWLHTGDLGCFDSNGHLHIRARISEVVLRGGANVYPAEIERVLQSEPMVRDVAVIGRPDERLGEEVVAVVELEAGIDAETALPHLRDLCARELARYKWPAEWHFMPSLPRNTMNKVARAAVKEMLFEAGAKADA